MSPTLTRSVGAGMRLFIERSVTALPLSTVVKYDSRSVTLNAPSTDASVGGSTNVSSGMAVKDSLSLSLWQPYRPAGRTKPAPSVQLTRRKSRREYWLLSMACRDLDQPKGKNGVGCNGCCPAAPIWPPALLPHPNRPRRRQGHGMGFSRRDRSHPRNPATRTALWRSSVSFKPSWPWPFQPHAYTYPLSPSASEKCMPAATVCTRSGSWTGKGSVEYASLSRASCPW